jgi:hypothetical protein
MTDVFSNMSPALADQMRKAVAEREANGFNVHFINADGKRDCYSFGDVASRDKFVASLKRAGRTIL